MGFMVVANWDGMEIQLYYLAHFNKFVLAEVEYKIARIMEQKDQVMEQMQSVLAKVRFIYDVQFQHDGGILCIDIFEFFMCFMV